MAVSEAGPERRVAAVILAYNRADVLALVLDRLALLPVDEVVVVDNGSTDGTAEVVRRRGGNVRLVSAGANLGIAGRNLGARETRASHLLFLDDDSYPLPGAVEEMLALFDRVPRLGLVGGLVRDVDGEGRVVLDTEVGTFDWWLRNGERGPAPAEGFASFFFPEGACLVRGDAFAEVGGFYEPFFFTAEGVELATRLLAAGWEVRYLPAAAFDHLKAPGGRAPLHEVLRRRIRNQLWYFWLRFPLDVAVRRMLAYGLFDLVNAVYRGVPSAWPGGVADAWRQRRLIRGHRAPVPRSALARVEGRRGRMHARLVLHRLGERAPALAHRRP